MQTPIRKTSPVKNMPPDIPPPVCPAISRAVKSALIKPAPSKMEAAIRNRFLITVSISQYRLAIPAPDTLILPETCSRSCSVSVISSISYGSR